MGSSQLPGCVQSGSQEHSNKLPLQQQQLLWCRGLWMQGKCFAASAFSQLCVQLSSLRSVRQQQHTDPARIPHVSTLCTHAFGTCNHLHVGRQAPVKGDELGQGPSENQETSSRVYFRKCLCSHPPFIKRSYIYSVAITNCPQGAALQAPPPSLPFAVWAVGGRFNPLLSQPLMSPTKGQHQLLGVCFVGFFFYRIWAGKD